VTWVDTRTRALSARDVPASTVPNGAVGDIYDAIDDGDRYGHAILDIVGALVPNDVSTFNQTVIGPHHAVYDVRPVPHEIGHRAISDFVRLQHEHPLIHRFARVDVPAPTRWRDVVDPKAFERSELYSSYYRPQRITHQVAVKVGGRGSSMTSVVLSRSRTSFTDEERALLAGTLIHLRRSYRLVRRLQGVDPSLSALTDAGLTVRQAEVATELCRGGTNAQLARRLNIGIGTLRKHLQQIFTLFGVDNRTSAVAAINALGVRDPSS